MPSRVIMFSPSTFVQTGEAGAKCIDRACREVLGQALPPDIWTRFSEVTGPAVVQRVVAEIAKVPQPEQAAKEKEVFDTFLRELNQELRDFPPEPTQGAIQLFEALRSSDAHQVILSGDWDEMVRSCFEAANFDISDFELITGSLCSSRSELLKTAMKGHGDEALHLYVGGSNWQFKAAQEAGVPFIGTYEGMDMRQLIPVLAGGSPCAPTDLLVALDAGDTLYEDHGRGADCLDKAFLTVTGKRLPRTEWVDLPEVTGPLVLDHHLSYIADPKDRAKKANDVHDQFLLELKVGARKSVKRSGPAPGAVELLQGLREKRVPAAITSGDWEDTVRVAFDAAGMTKCIEGFPLFTATNTEKTRAEIFQKALDELDPHANALRVHVGDGRWDFPAAQTMKMIFLGVGPLTSRQVVLDLLGLR